MQKEVMCTSCGNILTVDEFWAAQKQITGVEVNLSCPICTSNNTWENVENYMALGDRDAAIAAIRKKYKIPSELDKKMLISRYNGEISKPFEGNKFKLSPLYNKLFRINSHNQVVQKFDVVTKKEFQEGKEKIGMQLDLSSKKEANREEREDRVRRLKKFGVEIVQ